MVNTLAELDAINVAFVSVTEVFDTTTPQGRLLLHLVAAFAEFERATIVERVRIRPRGGATSRRAARTAWRPPRRRQSGGAARERPLLPRDRHAARCRPRSAARCAQRKAERSESQTRSGSAK